jgi:hypothetical protein
VLGFIDVTTYYHGTPRSDRPSGSGRLDRARLAHETLDPVIRVCNSGIEDSFDASMAHHNLAVAPDFGVRSDMKYSLDVVELHHDGIVIDRDELSSGASDITMGVLLIKSG